MAPGTQPDLYEDRIPKVVFAIDLLAALGQRLQVPEVGRLLYLAGRLLCSPDDSLKFPIRLQDDRD